MSLPDAILAPAAPGNYGSRDNVVVDLVVLHSTEGPFHSALNWFANPKAKVSAHYVVSREGVIAQCVPEGLCAHHAGFHLVNRRSIGVELEGYADDPRSFPVDSILLHTAVGLVANVCGRHGIPIDREHIIGHMEVADPAHPSEEWIGGGVHHHHDPGPHLDLDAFVARVRERSSGRIA